jgi:hypothetical protein
MELMVGEINYVCIIQSPQEFILVLKGFRR